MILIDENLSYKLAARIEADYKGAQAVSRIESLGEGAPGSAGLRIRESTQSSHIDEG